ncbi:MAG: sugar porter family MFS transporter [Saprospiraceae bacterium]|uniref:Sugar porter family MFS transporter n=1 Tax=Candidatus Opimibacter skivensis TaxID=2982028 RepID=A0A9D7T0X7_9BACT|nr:sugar porter family MFS transporter [Candidatus Opimibacter skivensis]
MLQNKLFFWSVTVAIAGFLFGFDTAVISGADQPIQQLWHLSDFAHGFFIMSMALWGTVIGAMFGGIPCERIGRKKTLIWIGVLYIISAFGSALAWDPISFSVFRFIGGIGVGASSVAAPTYISEIAPAARRGRLVALYQFNIVFGILIAYVSNYFLRDIGTDAWRWMLGVVTIPSIIYTLLVLTVPESPRWLVLRKKDDANAKRILEQLNPGLDTQPELDAIHQSGSESGQGKLFTGRYNKSIMLAFLIAFFNQLSGINFIIYYAPRILEKTGLGAGGALLSSAGIGITNLVFTMLGMYLIDRAGRKKLMLIGSLGYIISLAMISWVFYHQDFNGIKVPLFLFLFIASHAIGQGAVIWVYISEVFPNHIRASGQSLGTSTHWIFAAIITLLMPYLLNRFTGGPIFAFFAGMMVLQLLFVIFIMPETKGISLEELQKKLTKAK